VFIGRNRSQSDILEIIDGSAETHGTGNVRRTGLEFFRRILVSRFGKGDVADHVTPALPGGHGFEERGLAIEGANAGGAENLVAGEDKKVDVERRNVDGHVRRRLRGIDQDRHPEGMGDGDDLLNRIDCAEGVGDMSNRDQFGASAEQGGKLVENQFSTVVDRSDTQDCARLLGEKLPWHDIGVVFDGRDDNLVARSDMFATVALRNEVDRFRGATKKDNFLCVGGTNKVAHFFSGTFKSTRRAFRQLVGSAMDIGVVTTVEMRSGVDDGLWFLRGCGVIQEDKRLTIGFLMQSRKIGANRFDVERGERTTSPRVRGCSGWRGTTGSTGMLQEIEFTPG